MRERFMWSSIGSKLIKRRKRWSWMHFEVMGPITYQNLGSRIEVMAIGINNTTTRILIRSTPQQPLPPNTIIITPSPTVPHRKPQAPLPNNTTTYSWCWCFSSQQKTRACQQELYKFWPNDIVYIKSECSWIDHNKIFFSSV